MELIRFENQAYLWALLVIPLFLLLFVMMMRWKRKAASRFGDVELVKKLAHNRPRYKQQVKFLLLSLGLIFLVLGAANLQVGSKVEKVKREGVDVVIALDLSKSMMAEDIKPSRLSRARQFIASMIDQMANDRVALIIFAGNAYVQMPLTIDYAAARLFLRSVSTEMVPTQGTAIGDAIRLAMKSYEEGQEKYKSLLIISDGENHEGDALEAAEDAREEGVIINTVGIGTLDGSPVPVYRNNVQVDYVRDRSGNIVVSKLNPDMLQQIAAAGGGKYFRLSNSQQTTEQVMAEIAGMEKREIDTRIYSDYDDKFQYFLAASLFFILVEFMLSDRGSRWMKKLQLFK